MRIDYFSTAVVSLTKVHELPASKGGVRTYLLVDNSSASPIKFDFGVAPNIFSGKQLNAGIVYERDKGVSQSTVFIRGTLSTDQVVQLCQGFEQIQNSFVDRLCNFLRG